ncbi:MAG: DHHA1 domain-containing protein [Candidatus Colwellbacteria bacterium]|nr:DHHA1 domain-containing protein [Candidatus Colwellbacteria bacterium]
MKNTVVLYHNNCADGFSGAWVARKKFGDTADYIGVQHRTSPPADLQGRDLYLIDFSYPPEITQTLLKETHSLVAIDHHLTAKETVANIPNHVYSEDHSGCVLAWHYFFPEEKAPLFLQYVEDGDLWSFELPRSRDFYSLMLTLSFDFEVWDRIINDFENNDKRRGHLDYGAHIKQYQENIIEEQLSQAQEVILENHSALVVNSSILESQIGNVIVGRGYDIGIIWRYLAEGDIKVSLRSQKNGGADVRKIAEKYGGGGHASAAGFILESGTALPWQPKS